MTLSRADIELRAHEAGAGLTDLERAALGATLIQTVLTPAHAAPVLRAADLVRDHGAALMAAQYDLSKDSGDLPDQGKTTTHEQPGCPALSDAAPHSPASDNPPPCASRPPAWRARWAGFAHAMGALEDSLLGDFIAAMAVLVLAMVGLAARTPWTDAWGLLADPLVTDALRLSLTTSLLAVVVATVLGLPLVFG